MYEYIYVYRYINMYTNLRTAGFIRGQRFLGLGALCWEFGSPCSEDGSIMGSTLAPPPILK